MPPKVRELIAELREAGFTDRGGKGSHRNFVHPKVSKPITISGAPGDAAKHYQLRAVKRAVEESEPRRKVQVTRRSSTARSRIRVLSGVLRASVTVGAWLRT